MKVKVLVAGGAGFIGSHVVDGLIEEGFDVVVVDDLSAGKEENRGGLEKLDSEISDKAALN